MSSFGERLTTAPSDFPLVQFSGDGSTTTFALPFHPANWASVWVQVGSVVQTPDGTTYTFTSQNSSGGCNIVFSTAPYLGATIIVRQIGRNFTLNAPGNNTVNFNTLDTTIQGKLQGLKNVIIGGDFGTNPWQRGISFVSVASGDYTADRWLYSKNGTMVHTIQKISDAPTVAQAGVFTDSCLELVCTTAQSSIGSANYALFIQHIEGYNFRAITQQSFTVSFWVKAYKTGTYSITLINNGADRSYVAEYTINQSATWEKKTITVPASPSAGTWNYTNGIGLRFIFTLVTGSTYQGTAGSWQVGNFHSTSNQVNGVDSTNNYFRLALVQVEAGSTVTPFEQRSVQQELQLCQRYYQRLGGGTTNDILFNAYAMGSVAFTLTLPVQMRANPTGPSIKGTWAGQGFSSLSVNASNKNVSIGGGVSGSQAVLIGTVDSTTYIDLPAEL